MSDKTTIEWTDATWTPIRARHRDTGKLGWHCQKVSPGCENCYAETINRRLGTGGDYRVKDRGRLELFLDERMLEQPLRWKKPRRVFVCSMTDLFADFVQDDWIDQVFAVMALRPQHTFQVLTKRPEMMHDYLVGKGHKSRHYTSETLRLDGEGARRSDIRCEIMKTGGREGYNQIGGMAWPLPNVWTGVSVEDQQTADERIPWLLKTPAAVRFVSYEPAIGPVQFSQPWVDYLQGWDTESEHGRHNPETGECLDCPVPVQVQTHKIGWLIVGGESGPGARPMDVQWARDTIAQCRAAGVPVFYKQGGTSNACPHDRKGGHFDCFPSDLKVREYPDAVQRP